MKKFKQLGLIGCGMMGGSFALAAKRAGLVDRVVGYNKSTNKAEVAKRMGVIDDAAASILQAVMGADLILISVPVSATYDVFKAMQFGLHKEALVLDVGSTKASVIQAATQIFGALPPNFVPSHPIAGKERAGIEEVDVDLYRGKRAILTPTSATHAQALTQATEVWQAIGMSTTCMTAKEHDAVFAAVSHLPHLVAFAYMNGIADQKNAAQFLQMAGTGFQDFTRIAASHPEIWTDIFLANSEEILAQSDLMRKSLSQMEEAIREGRSSELKNLIHTASTVRGAWITNHSTSVVDE
jgi:prephenate dehydrogenase